MREIVGVELRLEADNVVGGEAAQDRLMHRQGEEDVRRRPWDVVEEAEPVGDAHLAQFRRHRDHVVVVHPHQVFCFEYRNQMVREKAVDAEIARHVLARIIGQVEPVVAERPEHAVGKAGIVFVDVFAAEIRQRIGDLALLAEFRRSRLMRAARLARPAEPEAAALPQRGHKRDGKAAGLLALAGGRYSVRYDDKPAHRTSSQRRDSRIAALISPTME